MVETASGSLPVRDRRKRVSKKNKIAWRKCNTKDVDLFLDELRVEERVGVYINTAKDEALFYEDRTPAEPLELRFKVKSKAERKLEAKKLLECLPKCFEALQPHTSVPDPVKKRNRIRTKEERQHPIKKKNEAKRVVLTAKEKGAIKNRALCEERKLNAPKYGECTKDLWDEAPDQLPCDVQWLNPTTFRHVLKHTRMIRKKVPDSVRTKPSVLPAIEAPHPGMSYNPSYKDHNSLLNTIVEKEKVLIKEEEHVNRVTDKMFSKVTREENDRSWFKEMSQGLPNSKKGKGVTIKEEDDGEYRSVNPPTKNKLKTYKQRRNIRLAKKEEVERRKMKIEKKKVADIYKLKKIIQNVEESEQKSLEKQEQWQKKKEMKKLDAKRLSRVKFEDYEPDFNMPFELSGNLRGVVSNGNILLERMKRMEKRNMIQPMVFQTKHGKTKRKAFTVSSHKDQPT